MTIHYSPTGKYTTAACGKERQFTTTTEEAVTCGECLDYLAHSKTKQNDRIFNHFKNIDDWERVA